MGKKVEIPDHENQDVENGREEMNNSAQEILDSWQDYCSGGGEARMMFNDEKETLGR